MVSDRTNGGDLATTVFFTGLHGRIQNEVEGFETTEGLVFVIVVH